MKKNISHPVRKQSRQLKKMYNFSYVVSLVLKIKSQFDSSIFIDFNIQVSKNKIKTMCGGSKAPFPLKGKGPNDDDDVWWERMREDNG